MIGEMEGNMKGLLRMIKKKVKVITPFQMAQYTKVHGRIINSMAREKLRCRMGQQN